MASLVMATACQRPVLAAQRGPCHSGHAQAPALRPPRPHAASRPLPSRGSRLACRAAQEKGGPPDLESQDFATLAKMVASKLAGQLAEHPEGVSKLQSWLRGEGEEEGAGGAEEQGGTKGPAQGGSSGGAAERAAAEEGSAKGGGGGEGLGAKFARVAGGLLGGNAFGSAKVASQAGYEVAAQSLGLDSFDVGKVADWAKNPGSFRERDLVKLVGTMVYRLIRSFEHHTGERFEGGESQYTALYHLGQEVLGGTMTKDVVRGLVKAYLRVAGR